MTKYPLTWPAGWRRTPTSIRGRAYFSKERNQVTIAEGIRRVREELQALRIPADELIISTNLELRNDGLPRAGHIREPEDPGVAVYWKKTKEVQHKVMAVDRYERIADNLAAIGASLKALRTVERHGGAVILERAFTGFLSLPAPNTWRSVMGYAPDALVTEKELKERYKCLSRQRHPDTGGTDAKMAELNWAMAEAERELS